MSAEIKPGSVVKSALLRLDIAQTLRKVQDYHGPRAWTPQDYATAADILASLMEQRIPLARVSGVSSSMTGTHGATKTQWNLLASISKKDCADDSA